MILMVFTIFQDDTQSRTEKIQLVVESKTQLRPLLKRMNFMDRLMTDSKSELQAIMTKSEGDLQGEREGMQQSEMKGSEVIYLFCNMMHLPLWYYLIIEEQHGGYWWPGVYRASGHLQPSWRCSPVAGASQEIHNQTISMFLNHFSGWHPVRYREATVGCWI